MVDPAYIDCSTCLGTAMVGLCGRTDNGSDGPCVLRASDNHTCYGPEDVAAGWTPAASCPKCCVCPCGSTDDGTECAWCHVTMTPGKIPYTPTEPT